MCGEVKGPDDFPRDRGRRAGRGTNCLPCAAKKVEHYRKLVSPELYAARRKANYGRNRETYRRYKLKVNFGLTLEQYQEMLERQNGRCAICLQPESGTMHGRPIDLAVDHDHATAAVRQLLCGNCNKGLGNFQDSPDLMRRAALYLENHRVLGEQEEVAPPS
jgi:hypothetical protein